MKVRIALAAILGAGFLSLLYFLAHSGEGPVAPPIEKPLMLSQSSDCQACHPEVYEEWKASWHAMAWSDPFVREKNQSDNFKKKDCIPCHAPRPVFERGIRPGERVVERASNRDDGVDCFSCHKLPQGGFASATPGASGDCDPQFHPGMSSVALCAPCHNQHNTVDEWQDSPSHMKGDSCNHCHMPVVERKMPDGSVKEGRSHLCLGGHSKELLLNSFTLLHELKEDEGGRVLIVQIVNDKTAHNLPGDSRHRALDLIVTFVKAGGLPVPAVGEKREYGQEPGTHRMRFRNPYRSETGKANTQIPAGEKGELKVMIPVEVKRVVIQIIYKLTPFMKDEEGIELTNIDISL